MSLSSLYAQLHHYQYQVAYWQNSADTYSRWIGETESKLAHKRDQLAKAQNALAKCSALSGDESAVEASFADVGAQITASMEEPSAASAMQNLYAPNPPCIEGAISECNALIARLEAEIAALEADLARFREGLDYSNRMVSSNQSSVSSTLRAIENYRDDD